MGTLREDIESAMDSTEEAEPRTATPSGAEEPQASAPDAPAPAVEDAVDASESPKLTKPPTDDGKPSGERARGPDGKFASAPKTPKSIEKVSPAAAPPVPTVNSASGLTQPAPAPTSWKPAAREVWAQIPPAAQAEIARREHDMRSALAEAAQHRKTGETWQRAVAPFEASIRANGGDPAATVGQLLQTQQALHFGTAETKAQLLATMTHEFGTKMHGDAFINAYVAALEGRPSQTPQMAPQEFRDPRVDQLMAQMQQAQAQRQQVAMSQAQTEAQSFASSHEFFNDLRSTMADLLEMADKNGQTLSLEDAYNRAVHFHPDIAQIVEQRKAAERAKQGNASIQRARIAGSSLRTQSAPVVGGGKPLSLRDQIEAAMDAQN
jgi:hypothetical protein